MNNLAVNESKENTPVTTIENSKGNNQVAVIEESKKNIPIKEEQDLFMARINELMPTEKHSTDILVGKDYLLTASGIYKLIYDKNGIIIRRDNVLHYPLIITGFREDEEEDLTYVHLECFKNDAWKNLGWYRLDDISGYSDLVKTLSGKNICLNQINAKDVVCYLTELNFQLQNQLKTTKLINKLGWVGDTFNYPGRNPDDDYFSLTNSSLFKAIQAPQGDYHTWAMFFLKLRYLDCPLIRFILDIGFVAPLLESLDYQLNPIFNIIGPRGCGKTTLAVAALSAWGNKNLMLSYNATLNGLEATLAERQDCFVVFDDTQNMRAKKYSDNFNITAMYQMSNGIGKQRANKDGSKMEASRWNSTIMLTSEQSIITDDAPGGMERRVLELNMDFELPHDVISKIHTTFAEHHGWGIRKYIKTIEFFKKHNGLSPLFNIFVEYLHDKNNALPVYERKHQTHLDFVAMVLMADALISFTFTEFNYNGFYKGYKKFEPELEEATALGDAIFELLPAESPVLTAEDIYNSLMSEIASDINFYQQDITTDEGESFNIDLNRGKKYGFHDDEYIYIYASQFKTMLHKLPGNPTHLAQLLKNKGLLRCSEGCGLRYSKYVSDLKKPLKVYCLIKNAPIEIDNVG